MEADWPLIERVIQGDLKSIQYNVKKIGIQVLYARDIGGRSLLHWAIDRNHFEIAQYLLSNEIDVNVKDNNGATPLDYFNIIYCEKAPLVYNKELLTQYKNFEEHYNQWMELFQKYNAESGSKMPYIYEIEQKDTNDSIDNQNSDSNSSKFWQNQPVKLNKEQKDISQTAQDFKIPLPENIHFVNLEQPNGEKEKVKNLIKEVNNLLKEDDANASIIFSGVEFHPTIETLTDILKKSTIWTGLREKQSNKLIGFIAGTILKISLHDEILEAYEVHSLVLHPQYRGYHLTPMLIQRLQNLTKNVVDLGKGIFTTSSKLPIQPIATKKIYFRLIRPRFLQFTYFLHLQKYQSMAQKYYECSIKEPENLEISKFNSQDSNEVFGCVTKYLSKFPLHQVFSTPTECEARIGGVIPNVCR